MQPLGVRFAGVNQSGGSWCEMPLLASPESAVSHYSSSNMHHTSLASSFEESIALVHALTHDIAREALAPMHSGQPTANVPCNLPTLPAIREQTLHNNGRPWGESMASASTASRASTVAFATHAGPAASEGAPLPGSGSRRCLDDNATAWGHQTCSSVHSSAQSSRGLQGNEDGMPQGPYPKQAGDLNHGEPLRRGNAVREQRHMQDDMRSAKGYEEEAGRQETHNQQGKDQQLHKQKQTLEKQQNIHQELKRQQEMQDEVYMQKQLERQQQLQQESKRHQELQEGAYKQKQIERQQQIHQELQRQLEEQELVEQEMRRQEERKNELLRQQQIERELERCRQKEKELEQQRREEELAEQQRREQELLRMQQILQQKQRQEELAREKQRQKEAEQERARQEQAAGNKLLEPEAQRESRPSAPAAIKVTPCSLNVP
jgi:hypothetical protein